MTYRTQRLCRVVPVAALGALLSSSALETPVRAAAPLQVSMWLPHWRKHAGAERFTEHAELLDAVSPFAFRVQPSGHLADTPRIDEPPWPGLRARAREAGVAVVPTVVWSDADARAAVLGDPRTRADHVARLVALVVDHGFDGLDVDYERKRPAERVALAAFARELSAALHARAKRLSCTIEPRVGATAPRNLRGRRASAWVDDYAVLSRACDAIRIMAYDQWAVAAAGNHRGPHHASLPWVRAILAHARKALPVDRTHLGIPTYGWQLRGRGRAVRKVRALGLADFRSELRRLGLKARRNAGGEWVGSDGEHTWTLPDAEFVRARAELAREAGLAGVALFKLDGQEPPGLWRTLAALRR